MSRRRSSLQPLSLGLVPVPPRQPPPDDGIKAFHRLVVRIGFSVLAVAVLYVNLAPSTRVPEKRGEAPTLVPNGTGTCPTLDANAILMESPQLKQLESQLDELERKLSAGASDGKGDKGPDPAMLAQVRSLEGSLAGLQRRLQEAEKGREELLKVAREVNVSASKAQTCPSTPPEVQQKIKSLETKLHDMEARQASSGKGPDSNTQVLNQKLDKVKEELSDVRQLVHQSNKTFTQNQGILRSEFRNMEEYSKQLEEQVHDIMPKLEAKEQSASPALNETTVREFVTEFVQEKVQEVCPKMGGMPEGPKGFRLRDYAAQAAGGSVVKSLTSATHPVGMAAMVADLYEWLSLQYHTKFPGEVISAHGAKLQMGHCWPMRSDRGNLTIRLCAPIHPSAATLEHLSLLETHEPGTMPRHFRIWGRRDEASEPVSLMPDHDQPFEFQLHGAQTGVTFDLQAPAEPVSLVTLEVLSNHGADYTCVYRLRVHASPEDEEEGLKCSHHTVQ